jgi:CRP-like cAMP-binding protein
MLDKLAQISTPFLKSISPDALQAIKQAAISMKYADGALIHNRGDEKPGLSIVRRGTVRVGIIRADGTFVIASLLGAGQAFGEFTLYAGLPRTHDIIAMGETEIWQLPRNRFLELTKTRPELTEALLRTGLVRSHILLEMIEAMRSLPVLERVAKTLVILVTTAGDGPTFRCRQSDLAATLGLSRQTLSAALKRLTKMGLVKLEYGGITLPDRQLLISWLGKRDI